MPVAVSNQDSTAYGYPNRRSLRTPLELCPWMAGRGHADDLQEF